LVGEEEKIELIWIVGNVWEKSVNNFKKDSRA